MNDLVLAPQWKIEGIKIPTTPIEDVKTYLWKHKPKNWYRQIGAYECEYNRTKVILDFIFTYGGNSKLQLNRFCKRVVDDYNGIPIDYWILSESFINYLKEKKIKLNVSTGEYAIENTWKKKSITHYETGREQIRVKYLGYVILDRTGILSSPKYIKKYITYQGNENVLCITQIYCYKNRSYARVHQRVFNYRGYDIIPEIIQELEKLSLDICNDKERCDFDKYLNNWTNQIITELKLGILDPSKYSDKPLNQV